MIRSSQGSGRDHPPTTEGHHRRHQLQQVIRRTVGGWASGKIRRRPIVIPIVIEA
ncbi:MAG: hypothetical protein IPI13_16520 [Actinomycetales bacterium]|uniref:Ribonuclease J C-terminal domain-containing protein n=1 Tax=Candidatus Phosphoribacter hodrii TaxID=2953743 RepID=A0A935IR92_9MICO|nr:hypothetical protein [Candidatus Phosphoribacter hodrii]